MFQESNYFMMSLIKKIFVGATIFLSFIFFSCNQSTTEETEEFLCSVKNFSGDTLLVADNNENIFFEGINLISDSYSRAGKYSIKLDSINQFAFSTKLVLKTDFMYELSFWQYGENEKVLAIVQSDSTLYLKSSSIVETDSLGWQKVRLTFSLTDNYREKEISLYVWNVSEKEVYIDDFQLKPYNILDLGATNDVFWMYLDDSELNSIKSERENALEQGVLSTNDDSWVKAMILWGDDNFKVKMRLKGDWLDHLGGEKWSFRIKIKDEKAFKGMKVFSIQNPSTRHFLDQWFLYSVFRGEDLLAPRYGFIYGQLNDDFLGIYAYEEHFYKQLVESLRRREGPILKHSEDSFWDIIIAHKKADKWFTYPFYESSTIKPFGTNKTLDNPTLNSEFNIAKNLVYQHKMGLANVSELFDVKKAAQFFALTNVMQGYHGNQWHNQRYYYNPVTSNLEFVAYDNYVGEGIFNIVDRTIFGDFNNDSIPPKPEVIPSYYLFKDSIFVDYYIKFLDKYSQKQFWDSVFVSYDDEIVYYQNFLLQEFPQSQFDKNLFYDQAEKIQAELPEYVEKVKDGLYDSIKLPYRKSDYYKEIEYFEFIKNYVNIYTQSITNNTVNLRAVNYYSTDLQIVKYGDKKGVSAITPVSVKAYSTDDYRVDFQIEDDAEFVVVSDGKNEVEIPIMKWSEPTNWSPRQELEHNNQFPNESFYKIKEKNVFFSGKQTINSIVLIPKNYNVIFEAGCEIDFVNGGAFLSYSPVFVNGTKEEPVKIYSSDKSARGFTVLQGKTVEMNYAIFDGFNTFNYKGWGLSGAVSIYECNTKISNSKFINNQCEDDLNIIRSHFIVKNSLFENTFSDAFDSDFCTGKAENCKFDKLGNDAIDFSTSEIEIINCTITNADDKAISGGEASKLVIKNCKIDGAVIGIAAKDNTVLNISDIKIDNVTYVLAAFMKKPEYGSAKIIADNISANNYDVLSLIEENSLLILDKLEIEGKEKKVAEMFY